MVFPLGDVERTRIVPVATYILIAINVVVFLIQQARDAETRGTFTASWAATPWEITNLTDLDGPVELEPRAVRDPFRRVILERRVIPQGPVPIPIWGTLITSMFLHGSWLHLLGNMLFLWIFGDNVEEVLGHVRYVIIYLCCGLIGSLAQIAAAPDSAIPTLGASGAIAGLMGLYLVWFPWNRVRVIVFYFLAEVPAALVIGLWLILQFLHGAGAVKSIGQAGGVAYLAHLAGAAAGIVIGYFFADLARRVTGRPTWFDRHLA
jgi:membrane associated rhomboid family serine protease